MNAPSINIAEVDYLRRQLALAKEYLLPRTDSSWNAYFELKAELKNLLGMKDDSIAPAPKRVLTETHEKKRSTNATAEYKSEKVGDSYVVLINDGSGWKTHKTFNDALEAWQFLMECQNKSKK